MEMVSIPFCWWHFYSHTWILYESTIEITLSLQGNFYNHNREKIYHFWGKLCNHTRETRYIVSLEGCGLIVLCRWYQSFFADDIVIPWLANVNQLDLFNQNYHLLFSSYQIKFFIQLHIFLILLTKKIPQNLANATISYTLFSFPLHQKNSEF